MTLELRDLHLLVEMLTTGTISGGAERCGMSLSSASARLAAMERALGVTLVSRHRRGVVATASGELALAHAQEVLAASSGLIEAMRRRARGVEQTVRLATNSSAGDALPDLLVAALNRLPETSFDLAELSGVDALQRLRSGELDLVVTSLESAGVAGCASLPLWSDHLVLVDPLGRDLDLDDLAEHPMIGLGRDAPLQRYIDARLAREDGTQDGVGLTYRIRLPTLAAVCAAAASGAGCAIVPELSARRHEVPARMVRRLSPGWARRRAYVVARSFESLNEPASRLVAMLADYRAEMAEAP